MGGVRVPAEAAGRTHRFELRGNWSGDLGRGSIGLGGAQAVAISVPATFGGTGPGTNPEELLLASALSCYMMTLARVLDGRGLRGVAVEATIVGEVTRTKGGLHFDRIRLRPRVATEGMGEDDRQRVATALRDAEEACFIAQTLRPVIPYVLEPAGSD